MDTFFIAFRTGDTWAKRFCKKGFSHCSVLLPFENGWLEINPTSKILHLGEITDKEAALFTKVLKVKVKNENYRRWPLIPANCVSMAKYFLGIDIWCYTPYGLYKKLTRKYKDLFLTEEVF